MYKGKVDLTAKLSDNTISFAPFRFEPAIAGVDSVELAAQLGDEISASVNVSAVATPDDGRALALSATETALNRLAYFYQVVINRARIVTTDFESMQFTSRTVICAPAYLALTGQPVRLVRGIGQNNLRAALEPPTQPGEHNFALLRSARLSISPVEEFMHLYAILLYLFGDKQSAVDAFILQVEPAVSQTPSPRPNARQGEMETIYTRLRNELAHRRTGTSIDNTKQGMVDQVGNLRGIVKAAIEQNP